MSVIDIALTLLMNRVFDLALLVGIAIIVSLTLGMKDREKRRAKDQTVEAVQTVKRSLKKKAENVISLKILRFVSETEDPIVIKLGTFSPRKFYYAFMKRLYFNDPTAYYLNRNGQQEIAYDYYTTEPLTPHIENKAMTGYDPPKPSDYVENDMHNTMAYDEADAATANVFMISPELMRILVISFIGAIFVGLVIPFFVPGLFPHVQVNWLP